MSRLGAWRTSAWRLLLAGVLVAGTTVPVRAAEIGQEIAEVSGWWAESFNAGDAARLAELYAKDAVVFPPSGNRLTGGQILDYWRSVLLNGARGYRLEDADLTSDDRLAIQTGQWHATVPGDGGSSVSGHLMNVFERQGDRAWKLRAQMWTPGR
jgi:uncharacterized protein (TIGR02246 family)